MQVSDAVPGSFKNNNRNGVDGSFQLNCSLVATVGLGPQSGETEFALIVAV